jgi:signal transduction histidine kinase
MRTLASWITSPRARPVRTLAAVLLLAFTIECTIMLLMAWLWPGRDDAVGEAVVDAMLLTLILAPVLWVLIVRPLQQLSADRGRLLGQLFTAQEEERGRLAQDMHDELGQHLTAILVGLRTIELAEDLPTAKARAAAATEAASIGLQTVRQISRGLRPTVLTDLGLIPAVERLCKDFTETHGIPVSASIDLPPDARFSPEVEICVFRVLQESLTNCARHAAARQVTVSLRHDGSDILMSIRDDGTGFNSRSLAGRSFGIDGMRQRVELLNGRFQIRSAASEGTTVNLFLPATRTAHEQNKSLPG